MNSNHAFEKMEFFADVNKVVKMTKKAISVGFKPNQGQRLMNKVYSLEMELNRWFDQDEKDNDPFLSKTIQQLRLVEDVLIERGYTVK